MVTITAKAALGAAVVAAALTGCATTAPSSGQSTARGHVIRVVAAEDVWGSLAAQLGGVHADVDSIITNPAADPHDYEPTAADGRAIAASELTVVNGIGYDAWAGQLVDANPSSSRVHLDVGHLVGIPVGGNPHRWYSPSDVRTVLAAITAAYIRLDPGGTSYFQAALRQVETVDLKPYDALLTSISAMYAGTAVAASESIFAPMASALGLDLRTPAAFLRAVSEGTEPTPGDIVTIDAQLHHHQVDVYVLNTQNETPDVRQQVEIAHAAGIPVVGITETLTPRGATFEQWQVAQLLQLRHALATATGR